MDLRAPYTSEIPFKFNAELLALQQKKGWLGTTVEP